jgi:hypothetical protein
MGSRRRALESAAELGFARRLTVGALAWYRDRRCLARRRAIQDSEKITPVDQPGSCWSHRHRPALISTPDTLAPVTQSL